MKHDFDAARDPWIPTVRLDGSRRLVGLGEALADAHEIASIESSNPLETIAIIRILLAMAHRVVDGPRNKAARVAAYKAGRFDASAVERYLERWKDRFGLFDDRRPFLQTPGLVVLDKDGTESPLKVETIITESSPNKTLFNHHADDRPIALTPAEALRALAAFQYYALPGLAKKTVNIASIGFQQSFISAPLLGGIATLIIGANLFETLCLNLLVYNETSPMAGIDFKRDAPPWEREPEFLAGKRQPLGYLDYLVPLSRHVRLVPEELEGQTVIRSAHCTQGFAYDCIDLEPQFHRAINHKNKQLYVPKASEDKALWRDSAALFAFSDFVDNNKKGARPITFDCFGEVRDTYTRLHPSATLRCRSFALVNDKANPILWLDDELAFPERLLSDPELSKAIGKSIENAEQAASALYSALKNFAAASIGEKPASKDVKSLIRSTGAESQYWASLEAPFKRYLATADQPEAEKEWLEIIVRTAREAFNRCVESRSASGNRFYAALAAGKGTLEANLKKLKRAEKGDTP